MKRILSISILFLAASLVLTGCSNSQNSAKTNINQRSANNPNAAVDMLNGAGGPPPDDGGMPPDNAGGAPAGGAGGQ